MNKFRRIQAVVCLFMKISLIQLCVTTLFASLVSAAELKGQEVLERKISIDVFEMDPGGVLEEIEKQAYVTFSYRTSTIRGFDKVTLNISDVSIGTLLEQLFGERVVLAVRGNEILLKPAVRPSGVAEIASISPDVSTFDLGVSGTIVDSETKDPLPGVNVLEKGTSNGTTTDVNGTFALSVRGEMSVLVFSFIGYSTVELAVGTRTDFSIELAPDVAILDEVVVVGYGTQVKESVVGSISQVSNERLKQTGRVTDLKQSLTGNLPGVTTITSSGEPGGTRTSESATQIFIRGRNTWNGGQPLIVVDGVERSMENIDVNEVESISILKDASATAVFGVKGANGVIWITTKRGRVGKPELTFSYNTTALLVSRLPERLDSYNALMKRNEAIEREVVLNETSWPDYTPIEIVNRYKLPQTPEYAMIYPNVDWEEAMFKDVGMSHYASMNLRGGTKFAKYFGSLAYMHEGDMFKEYDNLKGYKPNYSFDRFNFRSNVDLTVSPTTTFSVNLAGHYRQKNTSYAFRQNNEDVWQSVYGFPPDAFLPRFPDGRWGTATNIPIEGMPNPVALANNVGVRENRWVQLRADFVLEQKLDFITKGLSAKGSFFYDNTITSEGGLIDVTNHVRPISSGNTPAKYVHRDLYTGPEQDPSEYIEDAPVTGVNQFDWVVRPWNIDGESVSESISRNLLYQFQLDYRRKFGDHNVGALGLVRREESANGSMFPRYREDWVFRTTYDYRTRYLFEMNGAYNGSEQFGPGYRFDFFPSVAAGWVITNEDFFNVGWVSWLKARYSVGLVGDDQVSGGRWLYQSQLGYGGYSRMNANANEASPYTWFVESVVGNPDVRWEKALKDNYGLEIGLFEDMLSFNVEYFTEHRTDILLSGNQRSSIPPFYAASPPPSANIGEVKAKGYEIEMKFQRDRRGEFNYWATFAVTHTQNKILKRDDPVLQYEYAKSEGYMIGQTKSQIRTGFYNNWDEIYASIPHETNDLAKMPGFYDILDFNADGVIKADDSAPMGYPEIPLNTYNAALGLSYKGFSAMVQFYAVNNVTRNIPLANFSSLTNVLFSHVLDHWSPDNPNGSSFLPRWKTQGEFIGDFWRFDASYVRLKNAEVAYTFRNDWIQRAGLSSLKLYLNGNNLLFWSNVPDDREGAVTGGNSSDGAYPAVRRITLGVDLTF